MPGGYSGLYPSLAKQNGIEEPKTLEERVKAWHDTKSLSLANEVLEDLYFGFSEVGLEEDTDELIDNVILWGRSKGLDDPKAQLNKVIEEVGEIAHEITRDYYESPELEDAIGDTLVTLLILSDILDFDPRDCLDKAYYVIKDRKGHTENGTFIKDGED